MYSHVNFKVFILAFVPVLKSFMLHVLALSHMYIAVECAVIDSVYSGS